MADPFKDIAAKLIPGTLQPSATAGHIGAIGKAFTEPILTEAREFRGLEKKDIAEGEYAASPFRLDLAQQVGTAFGRKDWTDLAGEFEKKRNELLNFTSDAPGQIKKVPKMRKVEIEFNRDSLRGMKPGEEIKIGDTTIQKRKTGDGFAFRTDAMKPGQWAASKFGGAEEITKLFGNKTTTEQAIPGEFEEQAAGGGRTKEDIQKEMKDLRIRINRTIPSKTELMAMLNRADILESKKKKGGGAEKIDPVYKLKFNAFQTMLNDENQSSTMIEDQQKLHSDIPFESIQGFYRSVLEDFNFSFTQDAVKRGASQNMKNATSNSLSDINPEMVDDAVQWYRDDIIDNIKDINDMDTEAEKLLAGYELLMRVAPLAQNAEEAIVGAVGDRQLVAAMKGAVVNPEIDLALGRAALPKMQKDWNNMTKVILKHKVPKFAEKGEGLFQEIVDRIRTDIPEAVLPKKFLFFRKGTTSDSIREIVKKNLVEDPKLSRMAPSTAAQFENPNPTQQKWLALFYSAHGRKAKFADAMFTKGGFEAQTEERKAKELGTGDFGG